MDNDRLLCKADVTIEEALKKIDENTKGTVFIIDDDLKLCGVITDGDIRRGLLAGYGLGEPITSIVKKEFVFAKETDGKECIFQKFNQKVKIVPIVDNNMRVVDYSEYRSDGHISLAIPQLNGNEYKYLMDAFFSTWISSSGKYIDLFENSFSSYCGVKYGVSTSNGTNALHLALVSLGIGDGDEVIVPNLTFAATINSVLYTGATPVIVDVEEDSWCIDPNCIENSVSKKTKAIIPVHLYGQPCDMGRINEIANKYGLFVVEDCAEAHGAEWNGYKVGSMSDVSCFSFFGNKIITTGEGGMCLTNNKELRDKMRLYRDHGMSKDIKYHHEVIGYNYRMTNIQAAIGTAQVERIDDILEWREKLEDTYRKVFSQDSRMVFQRRDLKKRKRVTWLMNVLVSENVKDRVVKELRSHDVDVRPFFEPLSQMEIYKKYAKNCPISEKLSKKGITLPTTNEMNEEKVSRIYEIIKSAL